MDDQELRTLWCGNLSDKVTEEILYELFLQVAPLDEVRIPSDKAGRKANYGFIVLKHEASVDYVVQLLDGTLLYDRAITIKPRKHNQNMRQQAQLNDLLNMGAMLNKPHCSSPPYQHTPRSDRQNHNKPYHRHDNYASRHNRNNWNHSDRSRRRYH